MTTRSLRKPIATPRRTWAHRIAATATGALLSTLAFVAHAAAPGVGQFVSAGSMTEWFGPISATRLLDGRVLAVSTNTAQVFDPETGAWGPVLLPLLFHAEHAISVLQDGRVLVVGSASTTASAAELFDPATGTFAHTGEMQVRRYAASLATMPNGEVLVVGGRRPGANAAAIRDVEVYSPASGQFRLVGQMHVARAYPTLEVLSSGTVLIAGGTGGSGFYLADEGAEVFDPSTSQLARVGSMTAARYQHAAATLSDGRVLVSGGWSYNGFGMVVARSAEVYTPASGQFTPVGSMTDTRQYHTMDRLQDGRVLIAAGQNDYAHMLFSAEVFDPSTGQFTAIPARLQTARASVTSVPLEDGRILFVGGRRDSVYLGSAEMFLPDRMVLGTFE